MWSTVRLGQLTALMEHKHLIVKKKMSTLSHKICQTLKNTRGGWSRETLVVVSMKSRQVMNRGFMRMIWKVHSS